MKVVNNSYKIKSNNKLLYKFNFIIFNELIYI